MNMNFYLEVAAFVICIILWIASSLRYKVLDLRDKIYVYMLRIVTILAPLNLISCAIIRKNVFNLMWLSELIVDLSFLLMVLIWFYINTYLLETIHRKNTIALSGYAVTGLPFLITLILVLINWGTHNIFTVCKVEDSVQIVFNSWYKIPYILVAVCLITYLAIVFGNYRDLIKQGQAVFFAVPFIMLAGYYLQYLLKTIAILGFTYAIVLLLLYLYSYNYNTKIDGMTRLANREAFQKMLDYRIGSNRNMTVAMIALNDFKRVNREYGYLNGNAFIKEIAKYIEEVSPKKCIARYGGDVFGVILEDFTEEETKEWCDRILERFEHSWKVDKISHTMTACVTLVRYPDMADNMAEILDLLGFLNAYAKQYKNNQCIVCNTEFKEKRQRSVRIASILKEVIQDGKMYVKYQPILDVEANAYTRGEALFRLKDGLLGDISPAEFFPIAEENGYVIEIGYVLIDKICQFIRSIMDEGNKAPIISFNFSRQQIMMDDVESRIQEILNKYELSPDCIAIELSEEVFSTQFDRAKDRVIEMAEHGFRFYLDGFGTGLLDMSHLMELPFEIIKMHKKIIHDAEEHENMYLLVSAMTAVFEENGKKILGDGIESEHLKEIADMLFMDYLQGYYFSEPVTEEKAKEEFLKTNIVENAPNLNDIMNSIMEMEKEEF